MSGAFCKCAAHGSCGQPVYSWSLRMDLNYSSTSKLEWMLSECVTLPRSGGEQKAESWRKHVWRVTVLYRRWQADSTQTRTTNIYSEGALPLDVCNSLRTLLISTNVRPICARGEKVGVGLGGVGWGGGGCLRSTDDPGDQEWDLT